MLTSDLRDLGHSARAIASAVNHGTLLRPRRGIVVDPGLDPHLLFAARNGVLLSCVTQARRLGLWVSECPGRLHVASRGPGYHAEVDAKVHWSKPLMPCAPAALEDPLPNVLLNVARCLQFEHALATWESALNKRLIDLEFLSALPLPPRVRCVLENCTPFADSGLETLFRTRLAWLRLPIRAQTWLHGHRVDFLIGDRLIVQIDGKQHAGAQKISDYQHDASLRARGYSVVRVGYAQVMYDWPSVQEVILTALTAQLHRRA